MVHQLSRLGLGSFVFPLIQIQCLVNHVHILGT